MASVEVTGLDTVMQNLARLATLPLTRVGDALYEEGNRIMGESVQLVPVDTGLLRSTAHVARPETAGSRVEVELRYGGHGTAPYAAQVHNDSTMNHPHGGQAFYLQAAVFAATAGFTERLVAGVASALAR